MPTVPVARLIVPASALVAGVARLPFLHWPLGAEASYLLVGGQWRPSGITLYGSCWVDRPPVAGSHASDSRLTSVAPSRSG